MIKNITIVAILIAILGLGFYLLNGSGENNDPVVLETTETVGPGITEDTFTEGEEVVVQVDRTKTVIGKSVDGRDIIAYHFGNGDKELLFVSGIHGGYEANTVELSNEVIDYLRKNPITVPENIRVSIIPALNIDGISNNSEASKLYEGRFNSNGVDINRNFDCDWQEEGVWQDKTVSGGDSVFSEPESLALKSFVETLNPEGVVVWYSAVGGVFSSNCHNGVLPVTNDLTRLFAEASGYPANEEFDFYEITGDATNWLAKEGIPAISVLLTNHEDTEFEKNLGGIKAVFDYYAE